MEDLTFDPTMCIFVRLLLETFCDPVGDLIIDAPHLRPILWASRLGHRLRPRLGSRLGP